MSVKLIIGENALDPSEWEIFETDDVCQLLQERWESFPDTARIYHNKIAQDHDVTPTDEYTIDRLSKLDGVLYVVVYPEGFDPITVAIVVAVAAVAAAFLLAPQVPNVQVPNVAQRNRRNESSNNELSDRENKPRVNSRISDIFGTVISTPDLLSVPLQTYENNQQVETAYMLIGRGEYEISSSDIKDDETPIEQISGTSVEIYGPNTSPNSGDTAQLTVGTPIGMNVKNVHKSNSVNGQTLRPPNSANVSGNSDIIFKYPDEINSTGDYGLDDRFQSGDNVVITDAQDTITITTGGDELVTNGDFTGGASGWTLGTGWAYGTNQVDKISGTASNLSTSISVSDGEQIETQFDVLSYTSGTVTIQLSNSGAAPFTVGTARSSDGTFSETLTAQAGQNQIDIVADSAFSGSIDNVSALSPVVQTPTDIDLDGNYSVLSVSSNQIILSNPSSINPDWTILGNSDELQTLPISPNIESISDKWIGPFIIDVSTTDEIVSNFIAANGLYKDNGKTQTKFDVVVELEFTPVDASGNTIGAAETFQTTVFGSQTSRSERASTLFATPTIGGRGSIRARRVTNTDVKFSGTVVDEIKWRDLYALSLPNSTDFGNVTTVWSKTLATSGALSVKSRKLNMKVTRKIPTRISGTTFTAPVATDRVDDIFVAISTDKYIGNRSLEELDLDNIYDTVQEIETYFGSEKAVSFGYTFDKENMSYEETAAAVAASCFCTAYRQGSSIRLSFEKETPDSFVLFNHRNKLPNSETRTVSFGNKNDNDGVELEYINPVDGVIETYYVPIDQSAVNPKKIETIGIKSKLLAHFHAWREYNKILKQNEIVEFQATQEADILVLNDRILVADNTRTGTQDGEVESYSNLTITTSQPMIIDVDKTYYMFLQHIDGTVESIQVANFTSEYEAVLSNAPKQDLSLDVDNYARATYLLVESTQTSRGAFLLTEKTPQGNMTNVIRAVNYDDAFYANDKDFINGVVGEDGEYI